MNRNCPVCGNSFSITPDDHAFLEKLSPSFSGKQFIIPPPSKCPECRLQQRLGFRNERHLYRRPCNLCNKTIVSIYEEGSPFKVYCQDCWWGDGWDQFEHAREVDFSRPIYPQMKELQLEVPRLALMNKGHENSEYCNYAGYNKNCYLAVGGSWYNEDCLYGTYLQRCRDSVDCYLIRESELCYEVSYSAELYNCGFCADCTGSSNCFFSINLKGCKDCIFCSNLRNKNLHVFNEPVSKSTFEKLRAQISSYSLVQRMKADFEKMKQEAIHPALQQTSCENTLGDHVRNCKNIQVGFEVNDTEDGRYLYRVVESKDMMDCTSTGFDGTELFYQTMNAGVGGHANAFCNNNWSSNFVYCCDTVMNCSDCFACVGLKRAKNCVLNKEYREEEYKQLVARVIEHMTETGEWGEFFPPSLSPFYYNKTIANEFFPLEEDIARALGYSWTVERDKEYKPQTVKLPDALEDTKEDICREILACEGCSRNFKIMPLEFRIHQRTGIALPRQCPDCRYNLKVARQHRARLWERKCGKCEGEVYTSFSPDSPEKIYCQGCYERAVY